MSSSASSSGRWAARRVVAASLLLGLAACAHRGGPRPGGPPAPTPPRRIALFPMVNLSGVPVPLGDLRVDLERRLRAGGLEILAGDPVDQFLARHRVRRTGGVDGPTALAAQEELGVEAVLFSSVELYAAQGIPRFGMAMRLTAAAADPTILWMDAARGAGDDAPGLFGLGQIGEIRDLQARLLARLEASLRAYLGGEGAGGDPCPGVSARKPRVHFRTPRRPGADRPRVAVLPFLDRTDRPDAGEVVTQEVVRQLAAQPGIRVVEPGVVWTALVNGRVVMEGGVSHEAARIALGALEVDAVVAGYVHAFGEGSSPRVEFTVLALDTWENRLVWESTSYDRGDAGVLLFDLGRVGVSTGLLCGMVEGVAGGLGEALASIPARVSSPPARVPSARGDAAPVKADAHAQP